MKSIFEVLRDSQDTRTQITGDLVKWQKDDDGIEQIIGYCALGALACEADLVGDDPMQPPFYNDILKPYGIRNGLKDYGTIDCPHKPKQDGYRCSQTFSEITSLIPHLNDYHKMTFVQIADALESIKENLDFFDTEIEQVNA